MRSNENIPERYAAQCRGSGWQTFAAGRFVVPVVLSVIIGVLSGIGGVACGPPPPSDPVDSGVDDAGLEFHFVAKPPIPGDLGGQFSISIDSVVIGLDQLRVIGDASSGNDVVNTELSWEDTGVEVVKFSGATPGLYSSLRGEIIDLQIEGTAVIAGETYPFVISRDSSVASLPFEIPLSVALEPNENVASQVEVAIGQVVLSVDWGMVPLEDNTLVVESASEFMPAVEAALSTIFGAPVIL